MSWDPLEAHLSLLELARYDAGLRGTLTPIGAAIREASDRIDKAVQQAAPEDVDFFVDDQCELIENLLGAAFIVCQARITAVVSGGVKLAAYCGRKGIPFTAYAPRKDAILTMGLTFTGSPVTLIQFMDAVANYFKHRDEWAEMDWSKLTGQSKRTADVIQVGGLKAGFTGNLRAGAEALGNNDFVSTAIFADIIDAWSGEVMRATEKALGR
ncbi:hypothetical protein KEG38_20305 [Polyangium jinanense]|uniref:hypothetical protein n=1 Tax=Polyangium jinanense TaxID=2829994 RepID=UPI00234211F1|nr:hypothetical protein [Polyangium jinanense]MDC3956215.1 hypothetical protein [Polyangium jinanense]